ncbi:MAG TPA: (5-formylfuran-3-yl)methyl phosphate synthase [Gemmataceae bacterium]|nr:(5-formylfuran-3-yl)methyl phosphate synthase [Gemmataceae bacterium]
MTQLLVSVRSAMEAEAALRGGAALIDVKEPAHGSLGRASDGVIADVLRVVAGRRPVSAALGEVMESGKLPSPSIQLDYIKWGLAGSANGWQHSLSGAMRLLVEQLPSCSAVAVAYADWQRAEAPTPEEVCSFAIEKAMTAFLIDTWNKDGSTLLDWLPLPAIERLRESCRSAGVPMALAGSLGLTEIHTLLPLRPDWFAVRGAVCQGRQRGATIDEGKLRQLADLIANESEPRP